MPSPGDFPSHEELLSVRRTQQPCQVHRSHRPVPLRTVQHHIWPQEYGGPTVPSNLVWTCDTGHYNIHTVLALLLAGQPPQGARAELRLARRGLEFIRAAQASGHAVPMAE